MCVCVRARARQRGPVCASVRVCESVLVCEHIARARAPALSLCASMHAPIPDKLQSLDQSLFLPFSPLLPLPLRVHTVSSKQGQHPSLDPVCVCFLTPLVCVFFTPFPQTPLSLTLPPPTPTHTLLELVEASTQISSILLQRFRTPVRQRCLGYCAGSYPVLV